MCKKVISLLLIPFLLFYVQPILAAEKEEKNWQDESIYFIMVDRFNNGDQKNDFNVDPENLKAYNGGDLEGIIKRLDYIQKMGFTAIWLTPVVDNEQGGYHGYWTNDYFKVEEHFGSMKDMKRLVKEAHKRDMKVLLDFVGNHTGYKHPWLKDPAKVNWFHENVPILGEDQTSVENGWLAGLPDLNVENPEVKKFLIDNAKWWIQQTDVDGFRLDAVKHVPKAFWSDFSKEVKAVKKDFFLIGEVYNNDPTYIAEYEATGIDAFLNFPYQKEITAAFSKPNVSAERLFNQWKRDERFYQNPYLLGTYLDNHDLKRFTRVAKENKQHPPTRLRLALTYLFTSPGIPIMYYGTEIALDGGEDPDNRRLMDFKTDEDFLQYISKLGELRNDLPALRRGTFEMLYDENGMSVFKRVYKEEVIITAINNTDKTQTVELTHEQLEGNKELRGLLQDDLVRDNNGYKLVIDREQANVYALAEKSGLNIWFIGSIAAVIILFITFLFLAKRRGIKRAS
ncbi:alpha-amylase family glycosyl hydrolase [Ectobacillus sp. JY-23]|uniref:alpha-amylase family glycosyl hydrolase n=1 Tax=Ectobacillus sp. JY-23 TaxID=2933872 RepID=UPI001FF51B5B|nr:alpha-amylase family glycosyl hydrolase [Ectobacillus sp. JY-23]UOY92110.1 alpha-amylase family glycosyl hydrolase [Ectobacillus sp. JY-23]